MAAARVSAAGPLRRCRW